MAHSHFIPQFILRNFCSGGKITYCDLRNRTVQLRNTKSVFAENDYYPDEIEASLGRDIEHSFANLYHNKIENARYELRLSPEELFLIKKFLIVSAIRHKYEYTDSEKEIRKDLGKGFETDLNKNLSQILSCQTSEAVFEILEPVIERISHILDDQAEFDMDGLNVPLWAEVKDILHSYLVFVKCAGTERFLIPDLGRGIYEGPMSRKKFYALLDTFMKTRDPAFAQLLRLLSPRDYSVYPLSKDLAIVSMSAFFKLMTESEFKVNVFLPDGYAGVSSVLGFGDRNIIAPPKVKGYGGQKEYRYEVKRLNNEDVSHLNMLMLEQAEQYIGCAGLEGIQFCLEKIKGNGRCDYCL